jgi:hypothetical protein
MQEVCNTDEMLPFWHYWPRKTSSTADKA